MRKQELTVYYDGDCPICTAAAESWRDGADAAGLILLPLQDAPAAPDAPSRDALMQAIHVRGADGWLRGARALLAVYRRLGNRPMATLLRVGIALRIADPVYALIARMRMHLPARRRRGA